MRGAMRTRTKNPDGFMDGARRDQCAIVAEAVREWRAVDTNTAYIERGSPWENGYIESELLDGEIFYSLRKAKPSSRVGGPLQPYQVARARDVRARARRVAGCGTSNGSAGHAGAQANLN
jgi:hypothetical protein